MAPDFPQANVVKKIWDPADRRVWRGMYDIQNKKISDWVDPLLGDPLLLRKKHFLYLLLPLFFGGLLFIPALKPLLTWLWESYLWIGISVIVFTLLWAPFLLLVEQGFMWRRRVVFYLLAQERGWEYFYQHIHIHWEHLNASFPDLFFKGDQNKRMEDQLWGNFIFQEKNIDFWTGSFVYEDVVGKRGEMAKTTTSQCLNVALHLPSWQKKEILYNKNGLFEEGKLVDIHTSEEPLFKILKKFRDTWSADVFISKQVLMVQFPNTLLWENYHTNVFQYGSLDKRDRESFDMFLTRFDDLLVCFL